MRRDPSTVALEVPATGAGFHMSGLASLFVREVNLAIVGIIALAAVAAGVHYVSVMHEVRRMRQELCAAKLEAITSRNRYLANGLEPADACASLTTLTGESAPPPAAARQRTGA